MDIILDVLKNQKNGIFKGLYSCCSINDFVIRAVLEKGKRTDTPVLIEATANQVNQFGGYSKMTPEMFKTYVYTVAEEIGFNKEKLILGGDHLGPLVWSNLPQDKAMENARGLIEAYVKAGYQKIHIDTSMYLLDDDKSLPLPTETVAKRGAELCAVAERSITDVPLYYIIGSEVPTPGGAKEDSSGMSITTPENALETLSVFNNEFKKNDLSKAFENVLGLVVQPGVEFSNNSVVKYDRKKALSLTKAIKEKTNMVLEGHSTDFQTKESLRMMVEDGIAFLKVGPAFTFAMREALIALEFIEKELYFKKNTELSNLRNCLDNTMLYSPKSWEEYYQGDEAEKHMARMFSFSDRARYYFSEEPVKNSVDTLLNNLKNTDIPLCLLSQFMPVQYRKISDGILSNDPISLVLDKIGEYVDDYLYAAFNII